MSRAIRKQKAEIRRASDADLRKRARAYLKELRGRIDAERANRKTKLEEVRAVCRQNLERFRARIAELRAELRAVIKARREEIARCKLARYTTREAADRAVNDAIRQWADERQLQAEIRRAEGRGRPSKITAREKRKESDDEVRNNLSAELVPVWEAMKGKIRPTARISRTEAFLQWAHDHSGDVARLMADAAEQQADRRFADMLEEEKRAAKALERGTRRALEALPLDEYALDELAANESPARGAADAAAAFLEDDGTIDQLSDEERAEVEAMAEREREPSASKRAQLEHAAGYQAAAREIAEDGWSPAAAAEYLEAITPIEGDDPRAAFDRGFNERVRELANSRAAWEAEEEQRERQKAIRKAEAVAREEERQRAAAEKQAREDAERAEERARVDALRRSRAEQEAHELSARADAMEQTTRAKGAAASSGQWETVFRAHDTAQRAAEKIGDRERAEHHASRGRDVLRERSAALENEARKIREATDRSVAQQLEHNARRADENENGPIVMRRSGDGWRHYGIARRESLDILEMVPALLGGWKRSKLTHQGADDWPDMNAEAIARWWSKNQNAERVTDPDELAMVLRVVEEMQSGEAAARVSASTSDASRSAETERKATALEYAERLAALIEDRGLTAKAWSKGRSSVRVYLPGDQYLTIGADGAVSETDRGVQTYDAAKLAPWQREAVSESRADLITSGAAPSSGASDDAFAEGRGVRISREKAAEMLAQQLGAAKRTRGETPTEIKLDQHGKVELDDRAGPKALGFTRSGKPVPRESVTRRGWVGSARYFTKEDHEDAAQLHWKEHRRLLAQTFETNDRKQIKALERASDSQTMQQRRHADAARAAEQKNPNP